MNGKIEKVLWHESDDVSKIEFSIFAMEAFLKKKRSRRFICDQIFSLRENGGLGNLPNKQKIVPYFPSLRQLPPFLQMSFFVSPKTLIIRVYDQ